MLMNIYGGTKREQDKLLEVWGIFVLLICPPKFLLGYGLPFPQCLHHALSQKAAAKMQHTLLLKLDIDTCEGVRPQQGFWLNKDLAG